MANPFEIVGRLSENPVMLSRSGESAVSIKNVSMMAGTTFTLLLLLAAVAPQRGLAFQPAQPFRRDVSRTTHLQSALAAMPPDEENDIRNLLDEAVMMFQASLDQGSSTDEAESVICEVGKILYYDTNDEASNDDDETARQTISIQLDQAVMAAAKDPSLLVQVEVLATEYHRLLQAPGASSSSARNSNGVSSQLILSESQLRLTKLKQSLNMVADDDPAAVPTLEATRIVVDPAVEQTGEPATVIASTVQASTEIIATIATTIQASTDSANVVAATELNVKDESPLDPSSTKETSSSASSSSDEQQVDDKKAMEEEIDQVDIAIVGAGIGGLCAGAILNTLYGKKVGIYESHYLAGGCAHAFDRVASNKVKFTFDSGPTIVLGCSKAPFNPLRQVLDAVGQSVEWLEYKGWGMVENPGKDNELRWKVELGEDVFQDGPIRKFGSDVTLQEFEDLRKATKGLVSGAVGIPAMAMRAGKSALIPLLRYLPALFDIIKQGEELTTGTFGPYMDGPIFKVSDPWLRSWLDALAFSLSGLPATRTSAAAMAYVLFDMHRPNAALDYPRGGLGSVIDALVAGVEQGDNGSKVHLRSHVESIDSTLDGSRITGLTLSSGKKVKARDGVISNAPVWALNNLIKNRRVREVLNNFTGQGKKREPRKSWINKNGVNFIPQERGPVEDAGEDSLLYKCDTSEMTGSFLHLHLALKADGLDLSKMEAHYTVMDRSLAGDGSANDGPCGELNMIAVSNPCVIDDTLAPDGYMVVHAYGAGNEPYEVWKDIKRGSPEYNQLKESRSEVLWRAVESIIPDVRERVVLDMVGSPITHERFLRRPMGTYGAATEDYLKDGSTPFETLVLTGDSVFPGIGVPAVALSGASAANTMVSPFKQWSVLDELKRRNII